MAKKTAPPLHEPVDLDTVANALAKAVADGDIVNFRLLFAPFSPARAGTSESFHTLKYQYLLPSETRENEALFTHALQLVRDAKIWKHVCDELEADRPPQYPYQLLLLLGDNALREGKYSTAAQAYEFLRIRRRMQELFYRQGDDALQREDYPRAVLAYLIATGLAYDYAAFPDPMPVVSNFQTEALKLHGIYPNTPEDCIAAAEESAHIQIAFEYLLLDPEAATRLAEVSIDKRREFLKHLIQTLDPQWSEFAQRYREARRLAEEAASKPQLAEADGEANGQELERELQNQALAQADAIPERLLGRPIEGGEWWQYLKELAYRHPASVLFVARLRIGDEEILIPRIRKGSQLPQVMGLLDDPS